ATYLYGQEALYPFGHGLALEPTRWSDVALEASGQSVSVAVTLERDGAWPAHEVVQVYATVDAAAYPHDLGPLPALRLIGSRVVEVPASGRVRARLEIPWTRLRVWSEEAADFFAPTGTVTLQVARSYDDVERSAEVSGPVLLAEPERRHRRGTAGAVILRAFISPYAFGDRASFGHEKGSGGGEHPAGAQHSSTPNEDVRRRPTLPHPPECSTICAIELSFRVRNGTGRFLDAMTAVTQRDSQPAPNTPPTPERDRQRGGVAPREPHSGRKHSKQPTHTK